MLLKDMEKVCNASVFNIMVMSSINYSLMRVSIPFAHPYNERWNCLRTLDPHCIIEQGGAIVSSAYLRAIVLISCESEEMCQACSGVVIVL